jgi:hypothetical protein
MVSSVLQVTMVPFAAASLIKALEGAGLALPDTGIGPARGRPDQTWPGVPCSFWQLVPFLLGLPKGQGVSCQLVIPFDSVFGSRSAVGNGCRAQSTLRKRGADGTEKQMLVTQLPVGARRRCDRVWCMSGQGRTMEEWMSANNDTDPEGFRTWVPDFDAWPESWMGRG